MITTLMTISNEVHKGLLISWDYRFNTLTMLIKLTILFLLLSLVMGRGTLDESTLAASLIGFVTWFYAAIALNVMSRNLTEEAQAGTLEQMFMTTAPTWAVVLGRALSSAMVATSMIWIIIVPVVLLFGVSIPLSWEALPVFLLMLTGLWGLGFLIAGITLVFKQVDQFANLVENQLLYLSGAILPIHLLPGALETFSRFLPTTHGIVVIRDVTLEAQSLLVSWNTGELRWLIANSAAWLVFGWLTFKVCERIAKGRGNLGQY